MLVETLEEKDWAKQHQQQLHQLIPCFWEWFNVPQQQFEPWLAACHVRYWEHFENEEQELFKQQKNQEVEDEVEMEAVISVLDDNCHENKKF
jgi:hypothetical protein